MKRSICLTKNFKQNSTSSMTSVMSFIFILSWTPVSPSIIKTYETKSFSLYSISKSFSQDSGIKRPCKQIASYFLMFITKVKHAHFLSVLPVLGSAHMTNMAFRGERNSHWSSEGELRIPYKRCAFKPSICYSSFPSHENSKICGMFYGKLPF